MMKPTNIMFAYLKALQLNLRQWFDDSMVNGSLDNDIINKCPLCDNKGDYDTTLYWNVQDRICWEPVFGALQQQEERRPEKEASTQYR